MLTDEDILALYKTRRDLQGPTLRVGALIAKIVNGDYTLTLPELERAEMNSVVNLIAEGTDDYAQRIASTAPLIQFPALTESPLGQRVAEKKALIVKGWHHANRMPLIRRKRARNYVALATAPVYIAPGAHMIPEWRISDPLQTYPAPTTSPLNPIPPDCITTFQQRYKDLRRVYPEMARYRLDRGAAPAGDLKIDLIQYCDQEEIVLLALGKNDQAQPASPWVPPSGESGTVVLRLQRVPNIAEVPLMSVPGRITLSRLAGQFDQLIGMYESQGTLWAMHLHALKRAIFKEEWLVGRQNETPSIVTPADPYEGIMGVVEGGVIQEISAEPSVQTLQTLSIQERNQRLTGGLPAELGGESASNIRTARRGSQLLSSGIDFSLQEAHVVFEVAEEAENRIAIAVARAYWPTRTKRLIVPFSDKPITYTPLDAFGERDPDDDIDAHLVNFAYAGADTSQLVVEAGQRKGLGTLSNESFMEIDPMIRDVQREKERLTVEGLALAHMTSIQQQAAQPDGPYPPAVLARMIQLVKYEHKEVWEAELIVQKETQQMQQAAATNQLPPEQMQPGNAVQGAPGTPGAAQPMPTVPGVNPDQEALGRAMMVLHSGARGA